MKIALQLSALLPIVLLTGLPDFQSGMDSPIIISDGSTHLRHNSNFVVSNGGKKATAHDGGFTVLSVDCPGAAAGTCPGASLRQGWSLDLFDKADAQDYRIMHISNDPAADLSTVVAIAYDKPLDSSDKKHLVHPVPFKSAILTNPGGTAFTMKCKAGVRCEICIHYVSEGHPADSCPVIP